MSYIKRKGYGLMGVGGAENCTAAQDWDAGCGYAGQQGQCVPRGMVGKQPGCTYPTASSSGGGWFDSVIKGATEIFKAKVTPAPVTQITTTAPSGMSTTTKIALAGAAGLGLLLVLKSRKR